MISVIIPSEKGKPRDGLGFKDSPNAISIEYGLDLPDARHTEFPVRVVPPEALQALLRGRGKAFAAYENRFGAVSERDRMAVRALFELIEAVRSGEEISRKQYLAFALGKRRAERKDAKVQRTQAERDKMTRFLFKLDETDLKKRGPRGIVVDTLSGIGTLRLWWNNSEQALMPGLSGEDFASALYVHLILLLQNPESVAHCKRCGREYVRTKTTQVFCSARCGNNARKTVQRTREREEEVKRGAHKAR